jgi:hypothetical protein
LFGAFALGILALLPVIAQVFINASITIGGTSVLILVSVALQTLRSVESRALMVTYDQYSEPGFFSDDDEVNGADGALAIKRPRLLSIPRRKKRSQK